MSWSLVIDDLANYPGPSEEDIERIARDNISAVDDMFASLTIAKARHFASCVLSGGRTPMPQGNDEVADISIRGMVVAKALQEAIRDAIATGPDETSVITGLLDAARAHADANARTQEEWWELYERYATTAELPGNDGGG